MGFNLGKMSNSLLLLYSLRIPPLTTMSQNYVIVKDRERFVVVINKLFSSQFR